MGEVIFPEPAIENQALGLSLLKELTVIGPLVRSLAIQETEFDKLWNVNFHAAPCEKSPLNKQAFVSAARSYFAAQLKELSIDVIDVTRRIIWNPSPVTIWQVAFSGTEARKLQGPTPVGALEAVEATTKVSLPTGRTWAISEARIGQLSPSSDSQK